MRFKQIGNKNDMLAVVVHNADTVSIPTGSPLVLVMNGTNDGLDVVLPSTSAVAQQIIGLAFGVNTKTMAVGDYGESIVFGFTYNLLLIRQTRSDNTVSWDTGAALTVGQFLSVDTVNNAFVTCPTSLAAFTQVTAGTVFSGLNTSSLALAGASNIGHVWPPAVVAQTLATYAGSASTTADTRTAITASIRAFVHMM